MLPSQMRLVGRRIYERIPLMLCLEQVASFWNGQKHFAPLLRVAGLGVRLA